jgi:hypothetical protein
MDIPYPDAIEDVADWVELHICCAASELSKSQLARQIEGAKGEEPEESFINSVWNELERRAGEYVLPPFVVKSRAIQSVRNWQEIPTYLVCLLFSVYGGNEGLSASAKVFERLTAETLKNCFGFRTRIFGWPVAADDPKDIETRARNLAQEMNERFIEPPDRDKKDDTLDIAAWKPFHDTRSSQLILLLQCSTGKHWEGKTTSLRYEAWRHYIHWACNPAKGFALPQIVPPKKWVDICRDAGLILDRIRIYNIAVRTMIDPDFDQELRQWCNAQIERLVD